MIPCFLHMLIASLQSSPVRALGDFAACSPLVLTAAFPRNSFPSSSLARASAMPNAKFAMLCVTESLVNMLVTPLAMFCASLLTPRCLVLRLETRLLMAFWYSESTPGTVGVCCLLLALFPAGMKTPGFFLYVILPETNLPSTFPDKVPSPSLPEPCPPPDLSSCRSPTDIGTPHSPPLPQLVVSSSAVAELLACAEERRESTREE
mmetsp:Transcript_27588/g.89850  ORF Transcript_27588/g.89850 Transcript_27588/m.89850 type:complete len:206 (-) Transcript_27588:40-657(-)